MNNEPMFWDKWVKLAFWKGFSLGAFLGFTVTFAILMVLGSLLGV
jgi:hypothetical protein